MTPDTFGRTAWDIAMIDPDGFPSLPPHRKPGKKIFPHIGLGYLAASLERNGDRVFVLDCGVATHKEVQRFLSHPYQVVGITATSFTFRVALAVAQAAKRRYPQTQIVLGGPHTSIDPESCLKDPAIDFALQGESEQIMVDFIEVLKRTGYPKPDILAKIEGLVYRDQHGIKCNARAARIRDLDTLPYPAWHLFPMRRYQQHVILTSRGCPMDCAFCAIQSIWGREWIHRNPVQVVAEMEWVKQHWGNKLFHINDDNLTMNPDHARKLCEELIRRRLKVNWVAQGMRADAAESGLLQLMRKAGCHRVSIGIESSTPEVLTAIGKNETPEDMARAIQLCQSAGIQVLGMFMIGNPGDTLASIRAAVAFAQTTRIDLPAFYMALPYPRTRLWNFVARAGVWLNPDYLSFNHLSQEPVFETVEFSRADRLQAYQLAEKFCRKRQWLSHVIFWFPNHLVKCNRYELLHELGLLAKLVFFPVSLFRILFRKRTPGGMK